MDDKYFTGYFDFISNILKNNSDILDSKEFNYRLKKLNNAYSKMLSDEFYSQSHEIRAIDLFNKIGEVDVAKDSQHRAGSDIILKQKYHIECVSCTTGKDKNAEKLKESGYQSHKPLIDYNEEFRQISLRITGVIKEKKRKLGDYIRDRVILDNEPYIIFINLGPLSDDWLSPKFCPDLTRILEGRGFRQKIIDTKVFKQVGTDFFGYVPNIKNNNDADVCTNIFGDISYSCVSAIIFTSANLNSIYSFNNTVNFINPRAKNKIKIADFGGLPYWNKNNKDEYVPRIKGKRQVVNIY